MDRGDKIYAIVILLALIVLILFVLLKPGWGQVFESTVTLKNGIFEMEYSRENLDCIADWYSLEKGKKNVFYIPYKWVMGVDEKFMWIEGSYPPLHKFKLETVDKKKKVKLYKYNSIYVYKYDIKEAGKPEFLGAEVLKDEDLDKIHKNFKRDTTKVKVEIEKKLKPKTEEIKTE